MAVSPSSAARSIVVYSGRWWGSLTPRYWVDSHLRHLILPNNATVLVAVDGTNLCHAPPEVLEAFVQAKATGDWARARLLFAKEVADVFAPWHDVHTHVITFERQATISRMERLQAEYQRASAAIRPVTIQRVLIDHMRRWIWQWEHFAQAELFRRDALGPHDVIVRARLDTPFSGGAFNLSDPHYRNESRLHVFMHRAVSDGYNLHQCLPDDQPPPENNPLFELCHCSDHIHDYVVVGTPAGIAPLVEMNQRALQYVNASPMRCHGWCEEEQTWLQIRRWNHSVSIVPILGVKVHLERLDVPSEVRDHNSSQMPGRTGCRTFRVLSKVRLANNASSGAGEPMEERALPMRVHVDVTPVVAAPPPPPQRRQQRIKLGADGLPPITSHEKCIVSHTAATYNRQALLDALPSEAHRERLKRLISERTG